VVLKAHTLTDRVVRVINRFASAYRRVAQGRTCTTVVLFPGSGMVRGVLDRFAPNHLHGIMHDVGPAFNQCPKICISFSLFPLIDSSL
jgi:hypothetical protein